MARFFRKYLSCALFLRRGRPPWACCCSDGVVSVRGGVAALLGAHNAFADKHTAPDNDPDYWIKARFSVQRFLPLFFFFVTSCLFPVYFIIKTLSYALDTVFLMREPSLASVGEGKRFFMLGTTLLSLLLLLAALTASLVHAPGALTCFLGLTAVVGLLGIQVHYHRHFNAEGHLPLDSCIRWVAYLPPAAQTWLGYPSSVDKAQTTSEGAEYPTNNASIS